MMAIWQSLRRVWLRTTPPLQESYSGAIVFHSRSGVFMGPFSRRVQPRTLKLPDQCADRKSRRCQLRSRIFSVEKVPVTGSVRACLVGFLRPVLGLVLVGGGVCW